MRQERIADLNCRILGAGTDEESSPPTWLVFLCHGFGASGEDLIPLGSDMLRAQNRLANSVQFIFPEAPLSLESVGMPSGRAWWMLDLEELNRVIMTGEVRDQSQVFPDGLKEASAMLTGTITAIQDRYQIPSENIVLGGFSQGAMLSVHTALHLESPVAELWSLSGTLLCQSNWKQEAKRLPPFDVFISHGKQDPLLPFFLSEQLATLLEEEHHRVEFLPFDGEHTIHPDEFLRIYERLVRRVLGLELS